MKLCLFTLILFSQFELLSKENIKHDFYNKLKTKNLKELKILYDEQTLLSQLIEFSLDSCVNQNDIWQEEYLYTNKLQSSKIFLPYKYFLSYQMKAFFLIDIIYKNKEDSSLDSSIILRRFDNREIYDLATNNTEVGSIYARKLQSYTTISRQIEEEMKTLKTISREDLSIIKFHLLEWYNLYLLHGIDFLRANNIRPFDDFWNFEIKSKN